MNRRDFIGAAAVSVGAVALGVSPLQANQFKTYKVFQSRKVYTGILSHPRRLGEVDVLIDTIVAPDFATAISETHTKHSKNGGALTVRSADGKIGVILYDIDNPEVLRAVGEFANAEESSWWENM